MSMRIPKPWRNAARPAVRRLRGGPNIDALRAAGMQLGRDVEIADDAFLDPGVCALIRIDDEVTIGPKALVLAHDVSPKRHIGYAIIAPVHIKRRAYIGASAILLPGVTVGEGSIVAPGSVVTASVDDDTIVAGNPARPIGSASEMIEWHRNQQTKAPTWSEADWPGTAGHNEAERDAVRDAISEAGGGYLA